MKKPLLLPAPKRVEIRSGCYEVGKRARLSVSTALSEKDLETALGLQLRLFQNTGIALPVSRHAPGSESEGDLLLEPGGNGGAESYVIDVTPAGARITAPASPGLFHGAQTFVRLLRNYGTTIPCLRIEDEPHFARRGLHFDVSRGKVPKVETLMEVVDLLSHYGLNEFQLNVENVFTFRSHPDIGKGYDRYTPDDIVRLDLFCRRRFVDFVPAIQTIGHMGHILTLPAYRDLAEVPPDKADEEQTYLEATRGKTLDPTDPKARSLVKELLDEYLPLFSAPYANVCADEPFELGKGKNAKAAAEGKTGEIYLDHVRFLNEVVRSHGKTMEFWGDVILRHPELVPKVPKDAILLNWGYRAEMDYDNCAKFRDAGVSFYVCPGVSGWNQVMNNVENAALNITRFAQAGRKYGAAGLLNTEWGDFGHVGFLANSWHGLVLGAAAAWNPDTDGATEFDRAFSFLHYGDESGEVSTMLRRAGGSAARGSTWVALITPPDKEKVLDAFPPEEAARMRAVAVEGRAFFESRAREDRVRGDDFREHAVGCRLLGIAADKLAAWRDLREGKPGSATRKVLRRIVKEAKEVRGPFRKLWLARNRESWLPKADRELRKIARWAKSVLGKPEAYRELWPSPPGL